MKSAEKLPDHNPMQICPKCSGEYPIWRLVFDSQKKKMKAEHSFCSASTPGGGIINLCMKCKVEDNTEKRKNA